MVMLKIMKQAKTTLGKECVAVLIGLYKNHSLCTKGGGQGKFKKYLGHFRAVQNWESV